MPVNAQAVVNVNVNAQPFNDFMASFQKYVALLGKTPAAWAQMTTQQKQMLMIQQQGIAALMAQNEVMRKNALAAKDMAVHSEKAGFNWEKMYKRAKDMVGFIADIHGKIMKWGGILAGIITGMGGASAWGLDALGRWVRQGQITAGETGLTTGQAKALKGQFGGPLGIDTDAIAKGIARAREDPSSAAHAAISGLGLDARNLKGTEGVTQVLLALKDRMRNMPPEQLAELLGGVGTGDLGLNAGNLRMIDTQSRDDLRKSGRAAAADAPKLEVNKEAAKKWNEFLILLDQAMERLKTILANYLTPLLNMFVAHNQEWLDKLEEWMKPEGPIGHFIAKVPCYVAEITEVLKDAAHLLVVTFGKSREIALQWDIIKGTPKEEAAKRATAVEGGFVPPTPEENKILEERQKQFMNKITGGILFPEHPPTPGGVPLPGQPGYNPNKSYQAGTPLVPETGAYQLHQGEMVVPASDAEILRRSGMADWKRAISGIESAGSGGYSAVNRKSGATGKYQVMPANIPSWTREALGRSMTQEEFLHNPAAQERVFEHVFGGYVAKYGNPIDAASAWFTGRPAYGNRAGPDAMGTTLPAYLKGFMQALGGSGGGAGRMSLDINDNTGGNVALSLAGMAIAGPLPPFPL